MKFETKVKEIIQRTYNVKSFRFPRTSFEYKAGQFMYLTIRHGDDEMKKHFTISSSPTEKDFIEFTKKLTGSDFSNTLDSMKVGDWAKIDGPLGGFTFEGEYNGIGMLSGGIGITPLRSICKYCTDLQLSTKITLLYGNRSPRDIVFRDEFEDLQRNNRNLRIVYTVDEHDKNWSGRTGRINSEMVKDEIPDYKKRVFYTCGPPAMVETMVNILQKLGLSEDQIKVEDFPGY